MTDERFERLMRDAAASYRFPPTAPLDEMWRAIETRAFTSRRVPRARLLGAPWLAAAAALVVGIAVGRWSMRASSNAPGVRATAGAGRSARTADSTLDAPYQDATSRYLGQTAALLTALPHEVRDGRADGQFLARAGELLTTTRLLLDSPAGADPRFRGLLEDLELVLAQVVHLQHDRSRTEVDLINQALRQRDVMPRLRTAVADASAN